MNQSGSADLETTYSTLKAKYDGGDHSVENLCKLCTVCFDRAQLLPTDKQSDLLSEALKYIDEANTKDPNNFNVLKWNAIVIGQTLEALPIKKRIEQGKRFRDFIDKAIAINKSDSSVFYMRGRYNYEVAHLGWIERKLASTFFGKVPTATYAEVADDFLAVYRLQPTWLDNLLYLGKIHISMKEKEKARKYLQEASVLTATTPQEIENMKEVNKLLAKL